MNEFSDHDSIVAGPRSYYGPLSIKVENGVPFWCIPSWSNEDWEPCPPDVYRALYANAASYAEGEQR